MVFDPHHAVAGDPEQAPRTLRQPADAPPPPGHVREGDDVQSLSRLWESRRAGARTVRAWVGRVSGRSDRHLLFALAQATEAIAAHCDLLADRLAAQEAVTADATGAFGEEIARLRAEVLHLQRMVSLGDAPHE
jgi:hypothetical protein